MVHGLREQELILDEKRTIDDFVPESIQWAKGRACSRLPFNHRREFNLPYAVHGKKNKLRSKKKSTDSMRKEAL